MLALAVHIAVVSWISIRPSDLSQRPPGVEGLGVAKPGATVGGLPATSQRVMHRFEVRDYPEGNPVARARVRSVLDEQLATTDTHGVAVLSVRPAAKFILQVERPGFVLYAAQLENSSVGAERRHTILLKRADVPYYVIDTIFMTRCNHCHSAGNASGGVDVSSYDRAMRSQFGSGPIVVPGNPESSLLIQALTDTVPRGGAFQSHIKAVGRFPEFEVETLAEWIREGARKIVPR